MIEGFEIIDHVTCFSVRHTATRQLVGGCAFKTQKQAEAEAKQWLPWFYSVSFKQPRSNKLRWVEVPTQDVNIATTQAKEFAARRGIKGEVYGVSKTPRPTARPKGDSKWRPR
jgi:hypothetical protein